LDDPILLSWYEDFLLQREIPGLVEDLEEMPVRKREWYLCLIRAIHVHEQNLINNAKKKK